MRHPIRRVDETSPRAFVGTAPASLALPSGRALSITPTPEGERLTITGRGGEVELSVELTPEGPRLRMRAVSLDLDAAERITARCARFEVHAREELSLDAPEAHVSATRGDLRLSANDYVRARGERVLLNCDDPDPLPKWMEERLGARRLGEDRAETEPKPRAQRATTGRQRRP